MKQEKAKGPKKQGTKGNVKEVQVQVLVLKHDSYSNE